jgi:hypothetical protein
MALPFFNEPLLMAQQRQSVFVQQYPVKLILARIMFSSVQRCPLFSLV